MSTLRWSLLRMPLAITLAVALVAGGWVYLTYTRAADARHALDQERSALNAVRQRLAQADQEKQLIQRYLPAYQELRAQGIVGAEQRVNWLDGLRAASQEVRTFGVDYQLGQQGASRIAFDSPDFQLHQSLMKLQIRLLHEADLLSFLQALEQQRAGLFIVQSCTLTRSGANGFTGRFESRVNAECELAWLSLAPKAEVRK